MGGNVRAGRLNMIFGDDVVEWVQMQMPGQLGFDKPFGVGLLKQGQLVCAVVYDNYRPQVKSICASIAISDPAALNRKFIRSIFQYPFNELGCNRITCMIETNNVKSIKLCSRLGFEREGELRQASINGNNLYIYGMLRTECRWLT